MKPFINVLELNVIFVSSDKFWTWWNLNFHDRNIGCLSQPHFEGSVRSPLTLPKWGLGSPPGLLKIQNSILGVKTPRLEVFFIPLERSWSVDVQTGLAWVIWTSAAQVMVKRKARNQTGNLTPDPDPTLVRAGGMQHTVGKLSRRATSLF
jgi:hypothetical protein